MTTDTTWEIEEPFRNLEPFLIGTPRQFYVDQNAVYCVRTHIDKEQHPCTGCPYKDNGCELAADKIKIQVDPVPHSRRGIGIEERAFVILAFKPEHSFDTLPRDLWDQPYADKALDEANLHWALTDPDSAKFHTLKGQLRYYGTPDEFAASPYAEYFDVLDYFDPVHRITSLDFSAIEPRVSTIVSREPEWMKVFQGAPKVISRQVSIPADADAPSIYREGTNAYCFLMGEMDKETFEAQCAKCKLKDHCTTIQDHYKNVATDWHGINAAGLYGTDFTEATDKFVKKGLRDIAKIVGLALTYGGSAWTVSRNMHSSVEQAQVRIDNFFSKLTVLREYVIMAKRTVLQTGKVYNLFGRTRDVSRWSHSKAATDKERRSDRGYAERTALNHPIQSTAADILKIAMIRAADYLAESGQNPLGGIVPPQSLELRYQAYRDLVFAMLSTVHDELVYLANDDHATRAIPPVYTVMQIPDVMQAFKAGYSLEMDCEFDKTRSWTASNKFDTAKIYLLNRLYKSDGSAENNAALPPNLFVCEFSQLSQAHLTGLAEYLATYNNDDPAAVSLGVLVGEVLYLHPSKVPVTFLESWNVPMKKAVLN